MHLMRACYHNFWYREQKNRAICCYDCILRVDVFLTFPDYMPPIIKMRTKNRLLTRGQQAAVIIEEYVSCDYFFLQDFLAQAFFLATVLKAEEGLKESVVEAAIFMAAPV